jgi:superfamily I DNA/RNA helicase
VIGPPGTGKTTFLTRQCGLAAQKYGESSVLVASLTRAAAQEVAGRETGLPKNNVGTLHAHAFRGMDRPKIAESKEGVQAWNAFAAERLNSHFAVNDRYSVDPENAPAEGPMAATDGEKLLAEMQVFRARMTPRDMWPQRLRHFASEWDAFKADKGYLDFTDLIETAIETMEFAPGNPRVMFLDEAQDMSRLEMTLARRWGESCEQLVIVGDPFQNLYEWRGSEPEAFFAADAKTERVLSQSYRVPRKPHAYAVDWAKQLLGPGQTFPEYAPTEEEGEVHGSTARWNDPESLMRLINADLEKYPEARHPTVMILVSCGYMLDPLIKVLKENGVPFGNPYRPQHGGWNPMRGAGRLLSLLRPDYDTWGSDARMWSWNDLRLFVEPLTAKGLLKPRAKTTIEAYCARDRFGETRADELLTIPELMGLFHEDCLDKLMTIPEEQVPYWYANLLDSKRKTSAYPMRIWKSRGGAALRARPRVCLGTIHSVKGGEADSVYVFPDLSRQGYWNGWARTDGSGRSAVVRQFYVAFTRTRHKLTVCSEAGPEYVPLPPVSG